MIVISQNFMKIHLLIFQKMSIVKWEGLKLYNKKGYNRKRRGRFSSRRIGLALMGIETNFGKYLGKMDIVSSLATLSFDKRRINFY